MVIQPPSLKKGDTIAIASPAGHMERAHTLSCIATLEQWGFRVVVGDRVGSDSTDYFSGTDEERCAELQRFLDDPHIKGILCARGGYGTSRIIDRLHFKRFRRHPKWIIGFSDVTVLHCHIYTRYGIATLHGPMAAAFLPERSYPDHLLSLKYALEGRKNSYQVEPHPFNRKGVAVGELVGGNLALLVHLCGTDSEPRTRGRILFIEEVGEYLYNIDRMMVQLGRCGKLDKLAGLIVGGFTDCKDTVRPLGKTAEEIIRDAVAAYDYPVCFGFPVGHGKENVALKVGVGCKLRVSKGKAELEE